GEYAAEFVAIEAFELLRRHGSARMTLSDRTGHGEDSLGEDGGALNFSGWGRATDSILRATVVVRMTRRERREEPGSGKLEGGVEAQRMASSGVLTSNPYKERRG
ncbi:MAG: hypothetical protein ACREQB_07715, partial [Candidatus Binataceae bacterium]